jgi:protocatechuate 3,4-dioxygenase beta subunit
MSWPSLSLVLLLVQAGAVPQQQQVRSQDRGSIGGFVVRIGSGEPVAKATVTLSPASGGRGQSYTATTTSGGQFAFQNLEPGQYRLSASRNGFIRMDYGARSPNRPGLPITLGAGQQFNDAIIPIMPAGTIAGRVFDRDGEAMANVTVEALKYSYQEGQRVMNVVQSVRTNDLGEYRLYWLQAGQYIVSATPPQAQRGALVNAQAIAGPGIAGAVGGVNGARGRGQPAAPAGPTSVTEQASEGYVPVYYPGTTEAHSAAPIQLPAGVVFSGVDFSVSTVRTLRVQGQVINGATGQPAQNANVVLLPVQRRAGGGVLRAVVREAANLRTQINNQGGFEIRGVPPGSYELLAQVNQRNNRMTARLPLEIGAVDVQNVSLILAQGFTLNGRLAIEGQQQVGNQNQNAARMRVMLRPDASVQMAGGAPAAPVQADGAFTIEQVGRDDYRLTVSGMPRNAYVKMARYEGIDILSEGLRLDRQPSTPLEILVSTDTGIAEGVVQNEKLEPSANVMVVFVPDAGRRNRLDLYRTVSTDAAGRFRIEGVPPGDYRVFSWEDVETGAWQDPDYMRPFEDRGRAVRVSENATSTMELRVIQPQ